MKDRALLQQVFPRVIDNAKMLRNFVQIMRSGVVGRKSLGTAPKRLVRERLDVRDPESLFKANVGQDPSLADIVKMVHPRPKNANHAALFGYFINGNSDVDALPDVVREFEAFKKAKSGDVPDVPFQMLTALDLGPAEWTAIARRAPWQMTRMNCAGERAPRHYEHWWILRSGVRRDRGVCQWEPERRSLDRCD